MEVNERDLIKEGFILPNGDKILIDHKHHKEAAMEYLKKNNLMKKFEESNYSDEQDFLIFELDAIKVKRSPDTCLFSKENTYRSTEYYEMYYRLRNYKIEILDPAVSKKDKHEQPNRD